MGDSDARPAVALRDCSVEAIERVSVLHRAVVSHGSYQDEGGKLNRELRAG
jgi:hypothetical protein